MTEAEWLACTDPQVMIGFVAGKASGRKLRLFAVACARTIWHVLSDKYARKVVRVSEQYADRAATTTELAAAVDAAGRAGSRSPPENKLKGREARERRSWAWRVMEAAGLADEPLRSNLSRAAVAVREAGGAEDSFHLAAVLRDLFGSLPFRPITIDPRWLRWSDGTVPKIAQAIYDERRFGDLPILADALIDAGCDNEDILAHCRQPGPHARGCWVVDLLLGKE